MLTFLPFSSAVFPIHAAASNLPPPTLVSLLACQGLGFLFYSTFYGRGSNMKINVPSLTTTLANVFIIVCICRMPSNCFLSQPPRRPPFSTLPGGLTRPDAMRPLLSKADRLPALCGPFLVR